MTNISANEKSNEILYVIFILYYDVILFDIFFISDMETRCDCYQDLFYCTEGVMNLDVKVEQRSNRKLCVEF